MWTLETMTRRGFHKSGLLDLLPAVVAAIPPGYQPLAIAQQPATFQYRMGCISDANSGTHDSQPSERLGITQ